MAAIISKKWQCPACGAVYIDPQRDGSSYQHACPPLSDAELEKMGAMPALDPTATAQQQQTIEAERAAVRANPPARPGARNENILPGWQPPIRQADDLSPLPDAPRIAPGADRIPLGDA